MRLIDGDELLADIKAAKEHGGMGAIIAATLTRYVLRQPTIDAAPVVHGRWLKDRDGDEYCSKCSRYMPVSEVTGDPSAHDYCPNCGAKMDGEP